MSARHPPFSPEGLLLSLSSLPAANRYWVAFSGGADSTALLLALNELKDRLDIPVLALHVNHGLHSECDEWQAFCTSFCGARGIGLHCERVSPDPRSGTGLEAEARRLRYEVAMRLLAPGDLLLTAHHSDDQSETVLLNLMRGSGVDGLAGMPRLRDLGQGLLARPLLGFDSGALKDYLRDADVDWIEDDSNRDDAYDRNFLRNRVVPLLEHRWPHAGDKIAQSAAHCRESSTLLTRLADQFLAGHLPHPRVLETKELAQSEAELFKLVVRRWLSRENTPPMPARRLIELARQLQTTSADSHVESAWEGWILHHYRDRLWLQSTDTVATHHETDWTQPGPLELGPVLGKVSISPGDAGLPGLLRVTSRPAEAAVPFAGAGRKRIKILMQEAGIPPWLRDSIPLIWLDGEVLALGDSFLSPRFREWLDLRGASFQWTPSDSLLDFVRRSSHRKPVDRTRSLG